MSALAAEPRRLTSMVFNTWLYFIQAGTDGPIKIGVARDPFQRLETLQTGHHETLTLIGCAWATREIEQHIHKRYAADRIRGEWFRPTEDLVAFALSVASNNHDDLIREFPDRFPIETVIELEKIDREIIDANPEDEGE